MSAPISNRVRHSIGYLMNTPSPDAAGPSGPAAAVVSRDSPITPLGHSREGGASSAPRAGPPRHVHPRTSGPSRGEPAADHDMGESDGAARSTGEGPSTRSVPARGLTAAQKMVVLGSRKAPSELARELGVPVDKITSFRSAQHKRSKRVADPVARQSGAAYSNQEKADLLTYIARSGATSSQAAVRLGKNDRVVKKTVAAGERALAAMDPNGTIDLHGAVAAALIFHMRAQPDTTLEALGSFFPEADAGAIAALRDACRDAERPIGQPTPPRTGPQEGRRGAAPSAGAADRSIVVLDNLTEVVRHAWNAGDLVAVRFEHDGPAAYFEATRNLLPGDAADPDAFRPVSAATAEAAARRGVRAPVGPAAGPAGRTR